MNSNYCKKPGLFTEPITETSNSIIEKQVNKGQWTRGTAGFYISGLLAIISANRQHSI